MVYKEMNQLARYHYVPDGFLTTNQHFHDNPSLQEVPNGGPHKHSTHAKLHNGSLFYASKAIQATTRSRTDGSLKKTQDLDKAPGPRQQVANTLTPSMTYRGNGAFVVELPHSTITYKNPKMLPYERLGWRSEYTDKYIEKKPYAGYSTLSSRWTRPLTTGRSKGIH